MDPVEFTSVKACDHERLVLIVGVKVGVNEYVEGLRKRQQNVNNLLDLIRFNNETKVKELLESCYTNRSL